jgi:hypothetical protein
MRIILDKNRNGSLERDELPAEHRDQMLDLFDTDNNQSITTAEVTAGRQLIDEFLKDDSAKTSQIIRWKDIDHHTFELPRHDAPKATVFLFVRTDCPIANSYHPKLGRLQSRWDSSEVSWVVVYSQSSADANVIRDHAKEYNVAGGLVCDHELLLAKQLDAKVTPQAIVLDSRGQIRYSGRIDDQYVDLGKKRTHLSDESLVNAIEQLLSGQPVATPQTESVGCRITLPK